MCLCEEGKLEEARKYLAERLAALAESDVDNSLECHNLLAMVERYAGNFYESLRIHLESLLLARDCSAEILKARLHSGLGITYEEIASRESLPDYLGRALTEYAKASSYYQQAGDMEGAGDVENNIAVALSDLGRTDEAREHLKIARAYFGERPVKLAQVDETEARICLKEGRPLDAIGLIAPTLPVLIRHGEKRLFEIALRTQMKASADYMAR
ncbi:MAG TPA: hypothetical protein VF723_11360 [Pyrinomonadaceae bacterium]|jgi:tetratricopeptide (TPR) repeat protein